MLFQIQMVRNCTVHRNTKEEIEEKEEEPLRLQVFDELLLLLCLARYLRLLLNLRFKMVLLEGNLGFHNWAPMGLEYDSTTYLLDKA